MECRGAGTQQNRKRWCSAPIQTLPLKSLRLVDLQLLMVHAPCIECQLRRGPANPFELQLAFLVESK
jgi:hypothetical protein